MHLFSESFKLPAVTRNFVYVHGFVGLILVCCDQLLRRIYWLTGVGVGMNITRRYWIHRLGFGNPANFL